MSFERRNINLSIELPVVKCSSCNQKFTLIGVNDCAEFDVDNVTYLETKIRYCPYCGIEN